MKRVYQDELLHFLETIEAKRVCPRYTLPQEMVAAIEVRRDIA